VSLPTASGYRKNIVDFACLTHRTIVECDGEQHDENVYDETRDRWLEAHGWTVLRFRNSQVLGNRTMVPTTVAAHCYSKRKA
jgi:very-short-patch-repair endonuclease